MEAAEIPGHMGTQFSPIPGVISDRPPTPCRVSTPTNHNEFGAAVRVDSNSSFQ
jgi:hypothetical protein